MANFIYYLRSVMKGKYFGSNLMGGKKIIHVEFTEPNKESKFYRLYIEEIDKQQFYEVLD